MRFTARRLGMLACSVALNGFFLLSPAATATVSAARCQQECDAEYGPACFGECNYFFSDGESRQACYNQCSAFYTSCSMSAVFCSEPPANCMQGLFQSVTYDAGCQATNGSVWGCVVQIAYGWGPC